MADISTYAQWRAAIDRGDLRRVTWVCGPETVLVEEVVDTTRAVVDPDPADVTSHTAGLDAEADIWAAVHQHPLSAGPRLVVIRAAEKLASFAPLLTFVDGQRDLPTTHLLLVAGTDDLYQRAGTRKVLPAHLTELQHRRRLAVLVRCGPPGPADAIAWIRRRGQIRHEDVAEHLYHRCGADLAAAASVCAKLAVFDGQAGRATIDLLCDERGSDDYVEALVLLRKPDALRAAARLADADIGRVLGLLDNRLDLLATLHQAARAGYTPREITGVPQFLARRYLGVAKHYHARRCAHARTLLAVVDDALRTGARIGLLEALTALW